MPSTFLQDRGVVRVSGPRARDLLQGLFTCDLEKVAPGAPAYGALLTPQGKIIVDFIVSEAEGAFLLDCQAALAPDLAKRLRFYRLRAPVEIEDASASLGVAASWSAASVGEPDPRSPDLGARLVGPRADLEAAHGAPPSAYEAHRIACGVSAGGLDFAYGDTFPHEANMDRLGGVDFRKGCYVGQEVVSRVEHRGSARKRIVKVRVAGGAPAPGTLVMAGDVELGALGSSAGEAALATIRLDRAREALATGAKPVAAGKAVELDLAGWEL